jgi:hypothetical protein
MTAVSHLRDSHTRAAQLRERLIDLAVEAQAHSNRLQAHGGTSRAQAGAVLLAAWALADAARKLGAGSGGHPTLSLFFPDGRGTKADAAAGMPPAGDELEDEDGSE